MKACGACGETGHNRRTCGKGAPESAPPSDTEETVKPARDPRRTIASYASSRGENTFNLDEETREAIDWYLESRSPGYLAGREARFFARQANPAKEEED